MSKGSPGPHSKKLRRRAPNLPLLKSLARSLFQPCKDEVRFPDEIWQEIKRKAEWQRTLDLKERVAGKMHKVLLRELELKLRDPEIEEVPPVYNLFNGLCSFGLVRLREVEDEEFIYDVPTVVRANFKYSGDESTGMSYR